MRRWCMRGVIYALTESNTGEIRYIGQTRKERPEDRLSEHVIAAERSTKRTHALNWIRATQPRFIILEENITSQENLDEAERQWIAGLRAIDCDLCNMTCGGGAVVHDDIVRKKISAAGQGRHDSAETRKRKSEGAIRYRQSHPPTAAFREKMSEVAKKRYEDPAVRRITSEAMRGVSVDQPRDWHGQFTQTART